MSGRCDTGESTASIVRREDDRAWPIVRKALIAGAELRRPTGLRRYYPYFRATPSAAPGSLSETRVKTLERCGILRRTGEGVFALVEKVSA